MVPLADIVATATTSETPVLQGDWLTAGVTWTWSGPIRTHMREVDHNTLQQAGALEKDCSDTTVNQIGELVVPLASGAIKPDSVLGDLYDLIVQSPEDGERIWDPQQIADLRNGGGAHLDPDGGASSDVAGP